MKLLNKIDKYFKDKKFAKENRYTNKEIEEVTKKLLKRIKEKFQAEYTKEFEENFKDFLHSYVGNKKNTTVNRDIVNNFERKIVQAEKFFQLDFREIKNDTESKEAIFTKKIEIEYSKKTNLLTEKNLNELVDFFLFHLKEAKKELNNYNFDLIKKDLELALNDSNFRKTALNIDEIKERYKDKIGGWSFPYSNDKIFSEKTYNKLESIYLDLEFGSRYSLKNDKEKDTKTNIEENIAKNLFKKKLEIEKSNGLTR